MKRWIITLMVLAFATGVQAQYIGGNTFTSASAIGAFSAVAVNSDGYAVIADSVSAPIFVGVSYASVDGSLQPVRVKSHGVIEYSGWSFTTGNLVYLGRWGNLQDDVFVGEPVGLAVSSTSILVGYFRSYNVEEPHAVRSIRDSASTVTVSLDTWESLTNGAGTSGNLWGAVETDEITALGDSLVFEHPGDYVTGGNVTLNGTTTETYALQVLHMKAAGQDSLGLVLAEVIKNGSGDVTLAFNTYIENVAIGDTLVLQLMNRDSGDDAVIVAGDWFTRLFHK